MRQICKIPVKPRTQRPRVLDDERRPAGQLAGRAGRAAAGTRVAGGAHNGLWPARLGWLDGSGGLSRAPGGADKTSRFKIDACVFSTPELRTYN